MKNRCARHLRHEHGTHLLPKVLKGSDQFRSSKHSTSIELQFYRKHRKMPKNNTAIKKFVDSISDDKLKNFVSTEKTIVENRKIRFRLDHQGVSGMHFSERALH